MIRSHVLKGERILSAPTHDDIVAICSVRNETLRLPDILRHYRSIGVNRFVIIDNGSTDATVEYLLSQQDVDVYTTDGSYRDACFGVYWYEWMMDRYGRDRWYVVFDADEQLVYDGMDKYDLHQLTSVLRKQGVGAVAAHMIDMYSDASLADTRYVAGASMVEACPFFDGDSYRLVYRAEASVDNPSRFRLYGGARTRWLSDAAGEFRNEITKFPVIYWDRTAVYSDIHYFRSAWPVAPVGALLHFKFLNDLRAKTEDALSHLQHWQGSREYQRYAEALDDPSQAGGLKYQGSVRYDGPGSLIMARLMSSIDWPKP